VIGEGLFSFGDVDGAYPKAKLQHPLGWARGGCRWCGGHVQPQGEAGRSGRAVVADAATARAERGRRRLTAAGVFRAGRVVGRGRRVVRRGHEQSSCVRINLKTNAWCEVVFDGSPRRARRRVSPRRSFGPSRRVAAGRDVELVLEIRCRRIPT